MLEPAIAIVACGAITAAGRGLDALRSALRSNSSGLRPCARFDHPRYQSNIVGLAPREGLSGEPDDPAYQLANEALREACDQAHDVLAPIPSERIGLVLATTKANIESLERHMEGHPCSEAGRRHLLAHLLAADLAAAHRARGPVIAVSLACSSGLSALAQGARMIQRGDTEAVFVVGVDQLSAFVTAGFSALMAMDPAGCRPFDSERRGLTPGEAGAAMVLVRSTRAPRGSIQLSGWGSSNDANHQTGPSRDGSGLALAIRCALEMTGVSPGEIDYVNAHGTATNYNDAMESKALHTVFGSACPPVSGSKGLLGHTLGAAGVVETILCVLAMQERLLPGTPRLRVAQEGFPSSLVHEPRAAERMQYVLKLNTGFGGTNGAIVLRNE